MSAAGEILDRVMRVRRATDALCAALSDEDQQLQSAPYASPVKWHRAHTTWFFETFVLAGIPPYDGRFAALFNSYYEIGPRIPRAERGLLSRPSCAEVTAYRQAIDVRLADVLSADDDGRLRDAALLAVAHEQQHQELIATDVLDAFAKNPLAPSFVVPASAGARARERAPGSGGARPPEGARERTPGIADVQAHATHGAVRWLALDGGVVEIGARVPVVPGTPPREDGTPLEAGGPPEAGTRLQARAPLPPGATSRAFSFDNERPRHRVFLEPYEIASRLVTVGDVRAFIEGGGYDSPSLWLSDGWQRVVAERWFAPLHTRFDDADRIEVFDEFGWHGVDDDEPAAHLSFYEADAIARFLGARLPTEAEWEHAASTSALDEVDDVAWQWTRSAYEPYPGFVPAAGLAAEYNGKFMSGQMVLRGGSRYTPRDHVRASYRNYWPPETRFQRTGLRLARGR